MQWIVMVEVNERCGRKDVQVGGQVEVDGSGWELVNEGSCCNKRWFSILWLAATKRCDAVLTKSGRLQSEGSKFAVSRGSVGKQPTVGGKEFGGW